jgi:hypothetical protein
MILFSVLFLKEKDQKNFRALPGLAIDRAWYSATQLGGCRGLMTGLFLWKRAGRLSRGTGSGDRPGLVLGNQARRVSGADDGPFPAEKSREAFARYRVWRWTRPGGSTTQLSGYRELMTGLFLRKRAIETIMGAADL